MNNLKNRIGVIKISEECYKDLEVMQKLFVYLKFIPLDIRFDNQYGTYKIKGYSEKFNIAEEGKNILYDVTVKESGRGISFEINNKD